MIFVGTSGYNYPEWRGTFYPEKFPAKAMFGFYSERFRTVISTTECELFVSGFGENLTQR